MTVFMQEILGLCHTNTQETKTVGIKKIKSTFDDPWGDRAWIDMQCNDGSGIQYYNKLMFVWFGI